MKTIGLLGGMTAESSVEYYRLINEMTREKLGGIHSAQSVMWSVDFAQIEELMEAGEWDTILGILGEAARNIERAGADFLVICTNTIHKLADGLSAKINIPILNIIDATAERIKSKGFSRVGLLGTRFTMNENFYKDRLREKHGLEVLVPESADQKEIHRIIVEELSTGKIREASQKTYWRIIEKLGVRGAEGVILGCTEIPLLVKQEDGDMPVFDTTFIHAQAAVYYALR